MIPTTFYTEIEINNQIEKLCASEEFKTKLLLCKLLRYLVKETLEGREDKLKGFTIALDVFNKDHNFDPDQDPLVRINAGRLRRMLKMYYMGTGKDDLIKIDIPKGRYIPFFSFNDQSLDEQVSIPTTQSNSTLSPTVVILPFKNLAANADKDYLSANFSYAF